MELLTHSGGIQALLEDELQPGTVALAWLGQAGFALKCGQHLVLIDPYLSDSLAEKYRGKEFPHIRMMKSPVPPAELCGVDAVLCTHRHSDHMDPGTLPAIAEHNKGCQFVAPRAERQSAEQIGLPAKRIVAIDADETVSLAAGIQVSAIPSAHEALKTNDRGEHHYLGYVLRLSGVTLYHSGDCVPYDGLAERLRREQLDLAMLPINGGDEYRRSRGVPGNMTFDEADALCRVAGIPWLVPHHFGMFDFNTCDLRELTERIANVSSDVRVVVPRLDVRFELRACKKQVGEACIASLT
jgi:L-ascorbate metabolism protein UlaG (beta-lactamase superfamily)